MKTPQIYIETTIPNFFFDFKNQSLDKKIETVYFWNNNLSDFDPVTSLATIREIEATPYPEWRARLLEFVGKIKLIDINAAMVKLARQYVADGLVPGNYSADALHLAVTVLHKIDYLLTWNIQHLAHPFKRKLLRDYNVEKGLYVVEIVTPKELSVKLTNN